VITKVWLKAKRKRKNSALGVTSKLTAKLEAESLRFLLREHREEHAMLKEAKRLELKRKPGDYVR